MKSIQTVILALLMFLLCFSTLQASEARINNFGYASQFYIQDSYNVWAFPSTLVNYRDMVFVESNRSDMYNGDLWSGGIHLALSPTTVIGFYLSNQKKQIEGADVGNMSLEFFNAFDGSMYESFSPDMADHQFDVFAAFKLNSADLGFHISRYSSSVDGTWNEIVGEESGSFNHHADEISVEGGVTFRNSRKTRFDATIFYETTAFGTTVSGVSPSQIIFPEDYYTWGVGARLFHIMSPKVVLAPFAAYSSGAIGYRYAEGYDDMSGSYHERFTQYIAGVAVDLMPNKQNLISVGLGIDNFSVSPELTANSGQVSVLANISHGALPFVTVGLESWIKKWLCARFSFYELIMSSSNEFTEDNYVINYDLSGSTYAANFGLAFKLGQFTIDTIIDTNGGAEFLHNGVYLISGAEFSNVLFAQVSVTYAFNMKKPAE